jgi:hypothetical protein
MDLDRVEGRVSSDRRVLRDPRQPITRPARPGGSIVTDDVRVSPRDL